jgi:hypothetical protein
MYTSNHRLQTLWVNSLGICKNHKVEGREIEGKPFEMHITFACVSPPDLINFVSDSN